MTRRVPSADLIGYVVLAMDTDLDGQLRYTPACAVFPKLEQAQNGSKQCRW